MYNALIINPVPPHHAKFEKNLPIKIKVVYLHPKTGYKNNGSLAG